MKVRFILVEADDLNAADVSEIMHGMLAQRPALPIATPASVLPAEPPRHQIVPGWRPKPPSNGAAKKVKPHAPHEPHPEVAKHFECAGCGNAASAHYKRTPRIPCEKCNGTAWELVGAKGAEPVLSEQ